MVQPHSVSNREQVVDTMIELTRLSSLHRAIIAGSDSLELYLALRRRGFIRVSTTATCRIPRGQHAIGLITGQNSLAAIEAALDPNRAVPLRQRGHRRPDRTPAKAASA